MPKVYFYHLRIVATLILLFPVGEEKGRTIGSFDSSQRIHRFLLLIHQHKVNILHMGKKYQTSVLNSQYSGALKLSNFPVKFRGERLEIEKL